MGVMATIMTGHNDPGSIEESNRPLPRITSDFICFVCGAVFTTDEDRKQHLEREANGKLHDELTEEEKRLAQIQEKLNEDHPHVI